MARAVYSNADVFIFDDPLSALDARVARQVLVRSSSTLLGSTYKYTCNSPHEICIYEIHLCLQVFNNCIKQELEGKTRLLVTNQLHFLPQVDRVVVVCDGMIREEGTYDELAKNGKLFQKLMENAGKMEENVEEEVESETCAEKSSMPTSNRVVNESFTDASTARKGKLGKSVLIKQEERETGVVSWNVLMR